jgi:hypothetical protein
MRIFCQGFFAFSSGGRLDKRKNEKHKEVVEKEVRWTIGRKYGEAPFILSMVAISPGKK